MKKHMEADTETIDADAIIKQMNHDFMMKNQPEYLETIRWFVDDKSTFEAVRDCGCPVTIQFVAKTIEKLNDEADRHSTLWQALQDLVDYGV